MRYSLEVWSNGMGSLSGWWFQPSGKNISQNGNFPQVGVKIKKYLKPPPSYGKGAEPPTFGEWKNPEKITCGILQKLRWT